jgi:hypothetical protein
MSSCFIDLQDLLESLEFDTPFLGVDESFDCQYFVKI